MSKDRWLTKRETAFDLGVSSPTVARMIKNRELRGYKIRGTWRIRESDLTAYIEAAASMPEKREIWEQELEFRLHGRTIPGVVELSASDVTTPPDDVLALLSETELDTYTKVARDGDKVYALKVVLTNAYGERKGWWPT